MLPNNFRMSPLSFISKSLLFDAINSSFYNYPIFDAIFYIPCNCIRFCGDLISFLEHFIENSTIYIHFIGLSNHVNHMEFKQERKHTKFDLKCYSSGCLWQVI